MDSKQVETEMGSAQKLAYRPPQLTVYGTMRDLTKTGVGNLGGDSTSPYNVANQS